MDLKESEILDISILGNLDGQEVKMIRTVGGLCLATGHPKGKGLTVLGASSHPAILKHSVSKQFSNFRPSLMKSENGQPETVTSLSQYLDPSLSLTGWDLYSLKRDNKINYAFARFGQEEGQIEAILKNDTLIVIPSSLPALKNLQTTIRQITSRDALEHSKDYIVINNRRFSAKKVL